MKLKRDKQYHGKHDKFKKTYSILKMDYNGIRDKYKQSNKNSK